MCVCVCCTNSQLTADSQLLSTRGVVSQQHSDVKPPTKPPTEDVVTNCGWHEHNVEIYEVASLMKSVMGNCKISDYLISISNSEKAVIRIRISIFPSPNQLELDGTN